MDGLDDETLLLFRFGSDSKARAEGTIDRLLHGLFGTAVLLLKEGRYIIVNGESSPHIMMLSFKTS